MLSSSPAVRQRIAIGVIVAVGLGVLLLVAPYSGGLLLALVLHVLAAPIFTRLARRVSRGVAAAVVISGITLLIIAPAVWLVGVVITEVPDAVRSAQESGMVAWLSTLHIGPLDVGARLGEFAGTATSWVAAEAAAFVGGAASTVLNLVIALFGVYYLLMNGRGTWQAVRPFIPFSTAHADELLARFESATRATLLGSVLIAIIQGSLVGLGFWAVGLSSPVFWAVVATVASVLPLFGSTVVWIPGVIALIITKQYGAAIALAAFCGIIVSTVDNFVRPMVTQKISDVHPMITLVGAFAGLNVFGLLGLLLGPLAISYFFVLLRMYREEYTQDTLGTTSSSNP